MISDLRFAVRALWRSPVFTLVSVTMLAMGIGLSMFMFSSINAFVLKPLPFAQPEQLVHFEYTDSRSPSRNLAVPLLDWLDLRERQATLTALAAYTVGTANLGGLDGPAERLSGAWISADAFATLGVQPVLGRDLANSDQIAGAEPVALIGFSTWQQRFNADPQVIGRTVRINGRSTRIIGVMPTPFAFPQDEAVWMPLSIDRAAAKDAPHVHTFGRLKNDVSITQAQSDFTGMMQVLASERGEPLRGDQQKLEPFAEEFIPPQILGATKAMFIAVLLVLLIACTNVASLVFARFSARSRELAVRSALGASRGNLIAQVLAETLIIAAIAGVLGYVGADVAGRLMTHSMDASPANMPYWIDYRVDARDVAFSVGIALIAALLAGLLPAWRAGRIDVQSGLRQGGAGSIGDGSRLGRSMVAAEVALCVILLVCAGLSIRSAINAQQSPLGIDTEQVMTARLALFDADYADASARTRLLDALEPRLRELPGVEGMAFASTLPLMGYERQKYARVGDTETEDSKRPQLWVSSVSTEFFRVFGISLREGRLFDARDRADSTPVAVVSAGLAAKAWPDRSAIGQRVQVDPKDPDSPWLEVVGVVSDSLQADYLQTDAIQPAHRGDGNVFRPINQHVPGVVSIALRAQGDIAALAEPMRAAVTATDPDLPLYWLRGMDEWRAILLWGPTIIADMFAVFAGFALLLAGAGIYAVLAFDVSRRTREIGLRRALGASAGSVLGSVLRRAARQIGMGIAIGVPLALLFSQALSTMLMPGSQADPRVYLAVIAALVLVLLLAAILPVRRALHVDPMVALRDE